MENVILFVQEQYVIVISLAVVVFFFMRYETAKGGEKLSCSQVVSAVNADEAILLDVRDSKEYDAGHIVNAINIPHAKVADSLKVLEKYRQKKIIVIDKMGQQSAAVVKTLVENNFTAVRLGAGISDWQQDNLPLVK